MSESNAISTAMPAHNLTLEGSFMLHQMMRVNWAGWKSAALLNKKEILVEAAGLLTPSESSQDAPSAVFSMLGHKGDLLFLHFRRTLDELNEMELKLSRLHLWNFLSPVTSYLSVVELGLYESTVKTYEELAAQGFAPYSEEWEKGVADTLERQRKAMAPRLNPEMPSGKYLCFYPMDRKRGEAVNWYQRSLEDRQRMMREHGLSGRRFAGQVKQIISGSIGFDDWEWGVDLFADDPLVFKKLIYEMRYDEVSAAYALFGPFYVGIRFAAQDLERILPVE